MHNDSFRPPHVPTMCKAEEGKTVQSDRDASDINKTLKKYHMQHIDVMALPVGTFRQLPFGNMVGYPSIQEALNARVASEKYFLSLEPEVRALFGNDPVRFLDAWDRAENREVFEELGLLDKAEPEVDEAAVAAAARAERVAEMAEAVRLGSQGGQPG